jgi:hypothetical protein
LKESRWKYTMTAFPYLQREYARHGVATYPVRPDKLPAIRGYAKVGAPGSEQLALKFKTVEAAGFCAGRRNRLTVIDIDSSDDRLVNEIQARFGVTPLQVVTPSGGRHLYFRNSGEARLIRPLPDVDILGAGNVVAALSSVPRGVYALERGSLDDLAHLPAIRYEIASEPQLRANGRIPKGSRNNSLFAYCRAVVERCDAFDDLLDVARTWADNRLEGELPDPEIIKTARSAWNHRGGRKRVMNRIVESEQWRALLPNAEALALFTFLAAENGDAAKFMVADGLAATLGWSRRSVPAARKTLVELGIIKLVEQPKPGSAARYRWGVPDDS